MKISNLRQKAKNSALIKSSIVTILGSGGARIFLVLTTWSVARILSPDNFGQFSFVRSTLELVLSICAVNFSSLCVKYTAESAHQTEALHKLAHVFLFSFLLCSVLGFTIIILPENWLLRVMGSINIVQIIKYLGALLPVIFIGPLINGVYRGLYKFKLAGILQTISAIFFLICGAFSAWRFGVTGALWSVVAYYVFYSIIQIVPLLKHIRQLMRRLNGMWQQKTTLYKIILPMFLMSFIEAPAFWIAQLLLSKSGGFAAIGAMAVIMQLRNVVMIIPSYFFTTFMAFAAKMNSERNMEAYFTKFDNLIKLVTIIGCGCIAVFVLFGSWFLKIFGSEYSIYYAPLIWGVLSLPILLITSLLKIHFTVMDRQQNLLLISLAWNFIWLGLFAFTCKLDLCSPVMSFFITQDITLLIYLVSMLLIYFKDKFALLNGN